MAGVVDTTFNCDPRLTGLLVPSTCCIQYDMTGQVDSAQHLFLSLVVTPCDVRFVVMPSQCGGGRSIRRPGKKEDLPSIVLSLQCWHAPQGIFCNKDPEHIYTGMSLPTRAAHLWPCLSLARTNNRISNKPG